MTTGPGRIAAFLAADHARLDTLLGKAVARPDEIDQEAFGAFREGLLRHIAWEEKILFTAVRTARGGERLPMIRRLRIDHGAIAALLVPTPSPEIAGELRKLLDPHNEVEEGEGGLYEVCDTLLSAEADTLLDRMRAYPPVKVAPYQDGPNVCRTAEEALGMSAQKRRD